MDTVVRLLFLTSNLLFQASYKIVNLRGYMQLFSLSTTSNFGRRILCHSRLPCVRSTFNSIPDFYSTAIYDNRKYLQILPHLLRVKLPSVENHWVLINVYLGKVFHEATLVISVMFLCLSSFIDEEIFIKCNFLNLNENKISYNLKFDFLSQELRLYSLF